MLHMSKISDYLKILTDEEYLKSTMENLYSKPSEDKNLRKAAELFYSFLTTQ